MNWYYESGGQQQGPVTDSDLDRLLAEGKITPDTLIWREGQSGWAPLRTARPAPAAPAPGAAAPVPPPVPGADAPPPGYIRCTLTGKYFPPSEIIYIEGRPYSAEAKPQVVQSLQSGGALPAGAGTDGTEPAWERRDVLGMPKAAIETIKAVLSRPSEVFARMKQEGGLASPLIFNVIVGSIGGLATVAYQFVFQASTFAMIPNQGGNGGQQVAAVAGVGMILFIYALFVPVMVVAASFLGAGLLHLSLMILKCANRPFETTFRVHSYSAGSAAVLQLVPLCGAWVSGIWALVCTVIGISKTHNISTGKAVLAVFLPMIACCVIVGVFAAIFAAFFGFSAAAFNR